MKWEGQEESENLEDRRGLSKKGLAIGGVGALVVLLIGAFLGVDPQKLNQLLGDRPVDPRGGGEGQVEKRPLTPEEQRGHKFAATILRFTEKVWDEQFRKAGERYQ